MVRIGLMTKRIFVTDRRGFLAGLGAALVAPLPPTASAEAPQRGGSQGPVSKEPVAQGQASKASAAQRLALEAKETTIRLRPGQPDTPVGALQAGSSLLRFKPGLLDLAFRNDLLTATALNWRGLDGVPAAEPLTASAPLAAGMQAGLNLPLRHAGTLIADLRLLGDGRGRPFRPLALVVEEDQPPAADRDEVVLIEDWRIRATGETIGPGADPGDAAAIYTVNGQIAPDLAVRSQQRLRLRFVNGCQRAVIAVKIEGLEVRVMALDSRPAEPFMARNGALVLAPGGRADALIDVTVPPGTVSPILLHDGKQAHPVARLAVAAEPPIRQAPLPPAPALPATGMPAQLELKNALRVELGLGGGEWQSPENFLASSAPAFSAKAGRTVVLALSHRADRAVIFHLHGHHFRLLDRLDDGWKPFWLDTLAVEPGQTQRIAFRAEYVGRFLLESVGTDWTSPRLIRSYSIG
jgi:FtsP/CotA-like multicopper oxidase with cupredoxin domain